MPSKKFLQRSKHLLQAIEIAEEVKKDPADIYAQMRSLITDARNGSTSETGLRRRTGSQTPVEIACVR